MRSLLLWCSKQVSLLNWAGWAHWGALTKPFMELGDDARFPNLAPILIDENCLSPGPNCLRSPCRLFDCQSRLPVPTAAFAALWCCNLSWALVWCSARPNLCPACLEHKSCTVGLQRMGWPRHTHATLALQVVQCLSVIPQTVHPRNHLRGEWHRLLVQLCAKPDQQCCKWHWGPAQLFELVTTSVASRIRCHRYGEKRSGASHWSCVWAWGDDVDVSVWCGVNA